jgi:hypothetical protein
MSSSQSNEPRLSLNKISNYVLAEQNIDIGLLTSGHLNENHLWKPPEQRTHQPWPTSGDIKSEPRPVPKLKLRAGGGALSLYQNEQKIDDFKENYAKLNLVTLNNKVLKASSTSNISKSQQPTSGGRNEFKLPSIDTSRSQNSPRNLDEVYGMSDKEMALKILSSPLKGTTKQEKYKNSIKYEKEILKKDDLLISNVLHSNESVAYLENKLIQVKPILK